MPVLGNNNIGSNNSLSTRWYAGMFTSTEAGTITDFAAYLGNRAGITTNFKFVIYSDNSGIPSSTVLAQSSIIVFGITNQWWTGSISYSFAAAETLHFYIMSDDQVDYFYDNGVGILQFTETTEDSSNWSGGTPPTPPTAVVPSYDFIPSFYVNYTNGSKLFYRRFHKPALFKPGNAR